jgi:hypothetical protein
MTRKVVPFGLAQRLQYDPNFKAANDRIKQERAANQNAFIDDRWHTHLVNCLLNTWFIPKASERAPYGLGIGFVMLPAISADDVKWFCLHNNKCTPSFKTPGYAWYNDQELVDLFDWLHRYFPDARRKIDVLRSREDFKILVRKDNLPSGRKSKDLA